MGSFLRAASRSFAGRILGAVSALVAAYVVTTSLTIAESGVFFLGLGFSLFLSHCLRFGLDNFVLKKCAIYLSEGKQTAFLETVLAASLICIVGSTLIYAALVAMSSLITYQYLYLLLLAFPAAIVIALLGIVAHSLHASGFVFTGAVTNTSLHFLLFSTAAILNTVSNAVGYMQLFIAACVIALLVQLVISLFLYRFRDIKIPDWKRVRLSQVDHHEIYNTTLPLWLVVISQQLNQWAAQFISSTYVPEEQLALLAIAMRLSLVIAMMLTAVNMVVSPKFAAQFHKEDFEGLEATLTQSLKLLAVVSLLVFFLIIFVGDDILKRFGDQYVDANSLLLILVCGQIVNAITGPSGKLLMMSGFEKDVRNSSIVVAALGVIVAYVLTAKLGITGAAVSVALTIATQNMAFAYLVKHRLGINLASCYTNIFR